MLNRSINRLFRTALIAYLCWFSQSSYACIGVGVIASDLNFGSYSSLDSISETSSFDLEIECIADIALPLTFPLTYSLGVDSSYYGSNGLRSLKHETLDYYLDYALYQDINLSQVLGSITSNDLLSGSFLSLGSLLTNTFSAHGYIPGGQNVPAGDYTDLVVVTIEF